MSLTAEAIRADRVAIYIRWSTEDQGEGTTLDVQREACKAFIVSQGWTCRDDLIFVDDGVSGATMQRPALSRLRALVGRREVDCVVVFKLDRLSRSVLDMLKLVMEEWDGLCAVKSAKEPIDTLSPTGKMFFYQLMSFAEWERTVIRDRMFSGRVRRAQEGKSPGFVLPFGYMKGDSGQIELDPGTVPTVRRIFQLYLSGMGGRLITKRLTQEGLPTPGGGPWTDPIVMRILGNPAYAGRLVYGRTRRVKGKVVAANEPHVVKEHFFPVIVSLDEWEAVQALRKERPAPGKDREHCNSRAMISNNLLTGVLRCACGRSCTGIRLGANGGEYRYYVCGGAQATGSHLCQSGNLRQQALDGLVVAKLLCQFRGADARARLVDHLTAEVRAAYGRAVAGRQAAEQEVRRLDESQRRLKGLLIDGKLTAEEYREVQVELGAQVAQARAALCEALRVEETAHAAVSQERQHAVLCDRIDEWETLHMVEKKQLLRQFVSRISVYRDKQTHVISCDIEWRIPPARDDGAVEFVQTRTHERITAYVKTRERLPNGQFAPVG